jgi:hypothetical protein
MANIRQRLIGDIAIRSGLDVTGVDLNALLQRLVLFDTVVLKSARLKEIPFLVRALGYAGVMELLSSGALEIYCEATFIIQSIKRNNQRVLPIGEYNFGLAAIADHTQYIHDALQPISTLEGITFKQAQKLRREIVLRLIRPPSNFGEKILDQFDRDLRSGSPAIQRAINLRFLQVHGTPAPEFSIRLYEVQQRKFRAETNLFENASLSPEATNDLIESGLGAIGNLNHRLAEMDAVSALSGFSEDENVLFEDKLAFLAQACNPSVQEAQFRRILRISGFPEFRVGDEQKINVGRLLEIRQTRECAEFRHWVTAIDSASDEEITERVAGIRSQLSSFVHSSKGKTARLLATAGIGLIPIVGTLGGLAAGVADAFIVDKLLPESGAVSFISQLYPSVFERL